MRKIYTLAMAFAALLSVGALSSASELGIMLHINPNITNYEINGSSGTCGSCEDVYVNESGDIMTGPLFIEGATIDNSEIYLGDTHEGNKSIYFNSTGDNGWYFIRFSNDYDQIVTDASWYFFETAQFKGAVAGEPIIGVDHVYSYGDVGLYGSGGALFMGGFSKSGASMIIEQSGSVDFKTPNFTIQDSGEVCINCNSPAEMLDVNGNVTADDFITKSVAYTGDAVSEISKISSEPGTGKWVKVDHTTLGDMGVRKVYKVPVYEYVNVTVCEDVTFDDRTDNVCSLRQDKKLVRYDERVYEGVSLDKTVAMLIRANQQLLERVKQLEKYVEASK